MIFRRWGGATQPVGSFRSRRPSESEARSPGAPWFGLYRQLFGGGGGRVLSLGGGRCWTRGILGVCGPGGGGRTLGELRFLLRSGTKPMRAVFAGSQPRPGQERRKGRGGGEEQMPRGASARCTQLKVTQGGAYPRRQLAECPLAVPRGRSHVSRRVSLSQSSASIGKEREERNASMQGGNLTQVLLFGLPREGRNHLHGPWTECRVQGDEKTRPAVLDARSGDKDSERGVKGVPYQGREDKGSWRGADQAQASSSVVRAGARVRRAPPVGVAAPRGAVTDSESPVNLRSR